MKLIKIAIAAGALLQIYSCSPTQKVDVKGFKTLEEKASYAIGSDMGKAMVLNIRQAATQFTDLDSNLIKNALVEYLQTGNSQLDSASIVSSIEEYMKASSEKKSAGNIEAGKKYVTDQMAANPNLKQTASGLIYEVISEGNGPKPTVDNTVSAIYKGMLIDGTVFDDSKGEAREFPLKSVIKGWTEGIQLMSVGSKYRFIIPADLAYGDQERPPHIKPGSTLVFEVELKGIK